MSYRINNKILIIGPVPPPYHGVSVVTVMILESKIRKKYEILHLDTSDRRSLTNIGKLDFPNILLTCKQLLNLCCVLHKYKPHVVYLPLCQTIKGLMRDVIFISLSKMKQAKIVIHLHGSYFRTLFDTTNMFGKFLINKICRAVSKSIVLGEGLRSIFENLIPDDRIVVIPNGIDDQYNEVHSKTFSANKDNHKKILYLSSLAEVKGYLDVINAIPDVVKDNGSTEFIFAGDYWNDTDKEISQRFIERNNLARNVNYVGIVTGYAKKELFLSSDIFVLPSYNEGQPLVILEAMASGLPIIATDTGAISDMVIDGENGFIVEKQRPDQIAEKIRLLLTDSNLRKRMGRKNRERYLKYYTKDKFISKLAETFKETLKT